MRLIRIALVAFMGLLFLYGFIRLFNINTQPFILNTARVIAGGNIVEFGEAFSFNYDSTIRVCDVDRHDTDGDGFREWVVFYQSDPTDAANLRQPCPDDSPRFGAIFDNDRGEPPILFPYSLTPPDHDSLGQADVEFDTFEIVSNIVSGPASEGPVEAIEELLIYGSQNGVDNQLTIFKFVPNTAPWEPPTNNPPRYQVIGWFTGSGGVEFDTETKRVTVTEDSPLGRSQLVVKNVYALHVPPGRETYEETYMKEPNSSILAAPIESSIDFAYDEGPLDLVNTEFPELLVLGFFISLDQDRELELDWEPVDLLVDNAKTNYKAENLAYFFATRNNVTLNRSDIRKLAFTHLQYYPEIEKNSATETIEGSQPQLGHVEIEIDSPSEDIPKQLMRYAVTRHQGQWKINQRLK